MKFGPVPVEQSIGKILAHNLVNADGHKLLGKGHLIRSADLEIFQQQGLKQVVVAELAPNDLSENEAAQRVGEAVAASGVDVTVPGVGRANLTARHFGPLYINVPLLERLNNIDPGITIATLRQHTLVHPGELVALVKIIPFGIPAARALDVESLAQTGVIAVCPLRAASAALIISGPASAHNRLATAFENPVRARIEHLNSRLEAIACVPHEPASIAAALTAHAHHDLILIAGISAIIDQSDVVPTALHMAGGTVTHFGVPVDPGSLLMLGYLDQTPVLGAPGCIRSPKTNVIDWLLPRLLAGERITRADLVALGHGGLLEDISDRPMPRSRTTHREKSP